MRYFLTALGLLVVIGALGATKGAQIGKIITYAKAAEASGPPPETVSTGTAEEQDWEELVSAVGSVTTARGVSLGTDVPGVVARVLFESGATVKQGQVLVELDAAVERAQLASATSRRELALTTLNRSRQLVQSGAIPRAQVDADEAAFRQATTDAEALSAQIARKTIRAPFAGKLGLRLVNVGQYLNPGSPVATLESPETVHVDFSVPQQRLADVKIGLKVRVTSDATESTSAFEGVVSAINPTVDDSTRNVRVRADVQAADAVRLRPGMFVNVALVLPKTRHFVVVPATAVMHATYGDSVYVVEAPAAEQKGTSAKAVRQQFVRVVESRGDFVALEKGIKAKEEVVTAGAFKLRNHSPIVIDNSKKLVDPKLAPTPENR